MKKLIIALLVPAFLLAGSMTSETSLGWKNWNEGYQSAISKKKIALVDAYTDWCGWCKKMDRDTYANADIVKKINKDFVPIKFNPEKAEQYEVNGQTFSGPQLLAMLSNNQMTGYPTTFFIITNKTPQRVIIKPGYHSSQQFNEILDEVLKEAAK